MEKGRDMRFVRRGMIFGLAVCLLAIAANGCGGEGLVNATAEAGRADDRAPSRLTHPGQGSAELDEIDFNAFLGQLYSRPEDQRQPLVDSLITLIDTSAQYSFPLAQGTRAVFLLTSGSATSAQVAGDHNGWDPSQDNMAHVGGTTLWYKSYTFEEDARIDYKFVLNGSNWILDPRNPRHVTGGYGPNSELAMPGYVDPPEILEVPDIPHGTVERLTFTSSQLGNTRTVRVYTPPGYDPQNQAYPVIYVHDGTEYITLGSMDNVLDYCIEHHICEPVVAVFVDPVDRMDEYWRNDAFMEMFVTELIPWVEDQYSIVDDPAYRAVMGCSLGGVTSVYFGLHHPETFGLIGGHSSALWISGGATVDEVDASQPNDLAYYLDVGTYEGGTQLEDNQQLRDILQDRNNRIVYAEWHEGHSWGNWRAHIDDLLATLFPVTYVDE